MFPNGVTRQRPEFGMPFQQFEAMAGEFGFGALKILRPIVAKLQSDVYYIEKREQILQGVGDLYIAPGAAAQRIGYNFEEVAYATKHFGIAAALPDRIRNAYPSLPAAEAAYNKKLWRAIHTFIEKKLVAKLLDTGTFSNTGVAVSWKTHASSTPITDILKAAKTIYVAGGGRANVVGMSYEDWIDLVQSNEVRELIKHWGGQDPNTGALINNTQAIAHACGVDRIVVAGELKNTADKGQTATVAEIWTPGSIFVGVAAPVSSDMDAHCVGRVPTWNGNGDGIGAGEEPTFKVVSFRDEDHMSEVFRTTAEADLDNVIADAKAGYILTGAQA